MQTSDRGVAFLEDHEGVVLRAYRCPAGVWTIGAGLTAASGVVRPTAGMTISRGEATRLLKLALARNYEPAVAKALGKVAQHVCDGAVSFHFNTGAIARASWVGALKSGAKESDVRARLALWNKGGGKVLPGLVRRRAEEADVILRNVWPRDLGVASGQQAPEPGFSRFVVSVTTDEIAEIRDGFRAVGFEPGKVAGKVAVDAVKDFQRRYGLTVDGLIGMATLSTLQRELDARKRTSQGSGVAGGGGALAAGNEAAGHLDPGTGDPLVAWAGIGIALVGVVVLAWLACRYRDLIAARLQSAAPRVAAWLRSF